MHFPSNLLCHKISLRLWLRSFDNANNGKFLLVNKSFLMSFFCYCNWITSIIIRMVITWVLYYIRSQKWRRNCNVTRNLAFILTSSFRIDLPYLDYPCEFSVVTSQLSLHTHNLYIDHPFSRTNVRPIKLPKCDFSWLQPLKNSSQMKEITRKELDGPEMQCIIGYKACPIRRKKEGDRICRFEYAIIIY